MALKLTAGARFLFERWRITQKAVSQWVERRKRSICRWVHKAWTSWCINGCQENCGRYWTKLEKWGKYITAFYNTLLQVMLVELEASNILEVFFLVLCSQRIKSRWFCWETLVARWTAVKRTQIRLQVSEDSANVSHQLF